MIFAPKEISIKPGVYTFRAKNGTPLYIGKAANLKKRLVSYWRKDAGPKVKQMLEEAHSVEWAEAESEIDALLRESEFIKTHLPKYNILLRDDKNFFFVGITNPNFLKKTSGWQAKEDFPQIFITHQPRRGQRSKVRGQVSYAGPFTNGADLKTVLRLLRRLFPYCTCKEKHKRPCLNSEIGRCPGFCCLKPNSQHTNILENVGMLDDAKKEYRKNIRNIMAVLNGKKKSILLELKREMKAAAKKQEFERAAKIRNQIQGLENIFAHAVLNSREIGRPLNWDKIQKNLKAILGVNIHRAEGYDISNISGTEATGSMVVFVDGQPVKAEYRKFRIKTVDQPNDIAMHREVLRRRLRHPEWRFPDLMLIDGGRAQLNAAIAILGRSDLGGEEVRPPKIAALAKREEELYIEGGERPILLRSLPPDTAFFFQRVRDESHRFAKKYHHKRREILFRN